jgi:hypothetical protein
MAVHMSHSILTSFLEPRLEKNAGKRVAVLSIVEWLAYGFLCGRSASRTVGLHSCAHVRRRTWENDAW